MLFRESTNPRGGYLLLLMFVCLFVTESHVTHAGLILTHVGKADPSALAVLRMTGMHYHTVPGNQTQAFRNAG